LGEEKRALKKNVKKLNNIGVFSDDIRDAMRGSWMNGEIPGFVSGVDSLEESVKFGVTGASFHPQVDYTKPIYSKEPYAANPSQVINYVSCHDDMCLVDKLSFSKPEGTTDEELVRFNKLAQTVTFTSMGIPFIYAGEELYRTKLGVHNTYQSPDSINQINWDNKTTFSDLFEYYKGLIALRKAHPAFRIASQKMMVEKLHFVDLATPNVVAFTLNDHANGDSWQDILVIYNGNRQTVNLEIPEANWTVVCYDAKIDLKGIKKQTSTTFTVPASSAAILYK
jgi:pullulanase